MLCWSLGYNVIVKVIWVSTKCNPSDAPSRNAELPEPTPIPAWAARLFTDAYVAASSVGAGSERVVIPCLLPGVPDDLVSRSALRRHATKPAREDTATSAGDSSGKSSVGSVSEDDSESGACGTTQPEFREYYAGVGRLCRVVESRGVNARSIDAYASGTFDPQLDLSQAGLIDA